MPTSYITKFLPFLRKKTQIPTHQSTQNNKFRWHDEAITKNTHLHTHAKNHTIHKAMRKSFTSTKVTRWSTISPKYEICQIFTEYKE